MKTEQTGEWRYFNKQNSRKGQRISSESGRILRK